MILDGKVIGKNVLDEGFSGANYQNKLNKNRFDRVGAMGLLDTVKSAMAGGNVKTTKLQQGSIRMAASSLAESVGKNTIELQKAIDAGNDDLKDNFKLLINQLAKAQKETGKKSVLAIREIIKTVEKIQEQSPQASEALDLKNIEKRLSTAAVGSRMGRFMPDWMTKEGMNIDQDAGFLKGTKQAFTRSFGDIGFLGFGAKSKEEIQMRNIKEREELEAPSDALAKLTETQGTDSENMQKLIELQEKSLNELEKITENKTSNKGDNKGRKPFVSQGIDRDAPKTEKLLSDILKELKVISGDGIGGGGGGLLGAGVLGALFTTLGTTITAALTAGLSGLKGLKDLISSRLPAGTRPTRTPNPSRPPPPTTSTTRTTVPPTTTGTQESASEERRRRGSRRRGNRPLRVPQTGPTAPPAAAVQKGGGFFSKIARGASKAIRFAGPVGAVVTAGLGGYEAGKGFMADERASTTDRLFNAGSSLANTLSFGLLGRSSSEIESMADQRAALTQPTLAAPAEIPTASAIENTTVENIPAGNTTINNNTYNNNNNSSASGENIMVNRDTVRNSSSTLQRSEDSTFTG